MWGVVMGIEVPQDPDFKFNHFGHDLSPAD